MIRYERQQAILQYLQQHNPATVGEIARHVFASEASVRRDLASMEEKGTVKRIYGGVLLGERTGTVIPLEMRDGEHAKAKDAVAKAAAEKVFEGATVFLDASSTVHRMMKYLKGFKNLTVITNNLRIFSETEGFEGKLYCTGGSYNPKNRAFHGPAAEACVKALHADLFFFSSQGISEEGEISDFSESETALRKTMLQRATKSYFLCDRSKIGVRFPFRVCDKEEISGIFCDVKLPWEG